VEAFGVLIKFKMALGLIFFKMATVAMETAKMLKN
jgi:hypothetical protein